MAIKIKSCKELRAFIDLTNVKPDATESDIKKLCREAKRYNFNAACVCSSNARLAKKELGDKAKLVVVVGFPFGGASTIAKVAETKQAVIDGADEIDMVINIGALKSRKYDLVKKDIAEVVKAAKPRGVKVIFETGYLTKAEIIKACKISKAAGAKFVKTATGFGRRGATVADIKLMRKIVGLNFGIKAAGGIGDCKTAFAMIKAGANRIGASRGVDIILGRTGEKMTGVWRE